MQIRHAQKLTLGINMDKEINEPFLDKPEFADPNKPAYDYRNYECAGKFRGVGQAGKVGMKNPTSIDPMPSEKKNMQVPRDHAG